MPTMQTSYAAFLRGINVSGHHKVPMAELKSLLTKMGFTKVQTLLNSGNVVFEGPETDIPQLENKLESALQEHFGFPIPCMIRSRAALLDLLKHQAFADFDTKDWKAVVSFLKEPPSSTLQLPHKQEDGALQLLGIKAQAVCSVFKPPKVKTPDAMEVLEKHYGKQLTTRTWSTVEKLIAKF